VELLGRNSKRNNVTRLRAILAGHGRDRPPARATRSPQRQRRLDDQERTQLLASYNEGVMISDLAEMFGISQSAALANLARLGAEPRRGIVQRRLEEARSLYAQGWSLSRLGRHFGVNPATVRYTFVKAGVRMRPRPGR